MASNIQDKLIFYNLVMLFLVLTSTFGLSAAWPQLQIVRNPLLLTELLILVITGGTLAGGYCFMSRDKVKLSNTVFGIVVFVLSVLFCHIITVLYGAPFLHSVSETFHFSFLLCTVTVLPALCVLGPNAESWLRVFFQNRPEGAAELNIQCSIMCSLLGAWLGAFPIPLDWDRPWQVWPISCLLGTILGHGVGLIAASFRVYWYPEDLAKVKAR